VARTAPISSLLKLIGVGTDRHWLSPKNYIESKRRTEASIKLDGVFGTDSWTRLGTP